MSVIVRLQNLPWAANAVDIRHFFHSLSIPEGGVHIVGGELGDAFIAFSTDEDARQAMLRDGGKIKDISVKLYLSSRTEMQKIIDSARQQSISMQQFMNMPTMPSLPVPVPNIAVPNISVPPATLPNVQGVHGLQVPLQNVQSVSALVNNMGKQNSNTLARPANAIHDQADNKSVSGSIQSVKSDPDKDRKDRRRRRTRSHSNESSNSRSDSRSRSRSSSRSRDRKTSRDRHYDRRRKRSRSRDRRRRRDRSRSRDRVVRDRRKDYNRPREEADDNFQQQNQNRWNNPNQRNNRFNFNKQRQDFHNRDPLDKNQEPQNKINFQQKDKNSAMPPSLTQLKSIQGKNKDILIDANTDSQSSLPKSTASGRLIAANTPVTNPLSGPEFQPPVPSVPQGVPSIPHIAPSVPQNAQQINPTNFYGNYGPSPMLNQGMNFNMSGMVPFGNYPPMHPQMNMAGMMQLQPHANEFVGNEFMKSPTKNANVEAGDVPQDVPKNLRFDDMSHNNDKMQVGGSNSDWEYDNTYRKKETKTDSPFQKQFQDEYNRNNKNNSNMGNRRITNSCVQIKNAPEDICQKDVLGFFRNTQIPPGAIKIVADEHGNRSGEVFVKLNHIGDKKKAICRSGCLLKNSIVTVLHIDDTEFDSATDVDEFNRQYWNLEQEFMVDNDFTEDCKLSDKESKHNCIKILGSNRLHPLYDSKQKIHQHMRSICDQFKPNDVCIVKHRPQSRFDAFIKFDNHFKANGSIKLLSNTVVDGNPINVSTCSEEEFNEAKSKASTIDVEHFFKIIGNLEGNTQEDKADPRVQTTDTKPQSNVSNNKVVKNKGGEVEVKRSNKVLLPTPLLPQPTVNPPASMPHTNCIVINNLPSEATDKDICEFFSDIGPDPIQIHIMLDSDGSYTGEAYCEFVTNEEAMNASTKNNCVLANTCVGVQPVTRNEMFNAIGTTLRPQGQQGILPLLYNIQPAPQGPPSLFANTIHMDFQGGNDGGWNPSTRGENSSNFDRGFRGGRGGRGRGDGEFGGRGRGDFGGRGRGRGDGEFGGRGRGRGDGEFGGRGRGRGDGEFGGRGRGRDGEFGGRGRGRGDSEFGGRPSRGRGDNEFGGRPSRGRGDNEFGGQQLRGRGDGEFGGRPSRGRSDGMTRGRGGESYRGGRGENSYRGGRDRGGFRGGHRGSDNYEGRGNADDFPMHDDSDSMSSNKNEGSSPLAPITRPIQLEADSVREFGQHGCVVSAENVPYRAELNDILKFFEDFDLPAESVIRRYNDAGQVTGDARIAFKTPAEAKRAIKYLNNERIFNRNISLNLFK